MRLTSLLILLIPALFSSCGPSTKSSAVRETVFGGTVDIEFDKQDQLVFYYETRPNFDYAHLYREDGLDYLLVANKKQHSIDFFQIDTGLKIDSMMLALEGPNGLPRLSNFLYAADTLYAVNAFSYELIMFDKNGIALKRVRVKPNAQFDSLLPRYFTPSEIMKIGDLVYVFGDPDLNPLERNSYSKGKYAYEINIKTGEVRSLFDVPAIYRDQSWMINQYFYRQLYDAKYGRWLFSFEVEDSVRTYALDGNQQSFEAKSRVTGDIRKWNRNDMNSKEAYRYYLGQKTYGKLVYDRKNNLYYRFVRHPNEQAMMDKDVDAMWTRGFSIVVLNGDLQQVGETIIMDKTIGEVHLATDDGIYLSYFDETTAVEGEKRYVKLNPVINDDL